MLIMEGKYSSAIGAMIRTNRLHRRAIESIVDSTGIHHSQHKLLMYIAGENAPSSQKELAQLFGISPAAITGALSKLERDGYIERRCAKDGRKNEIKITDAGRAIVESSKRHFQCIDEQFFEGFTDEELEAYCSFLERMQKNASRIIQRREKTNEEMV